MMKPDHAIRIGQPERVCIFPAGATTPARPERARSNFGPWWPFATPLRLSETDSKRIRLQIVNTRSCVHLWLKCFLIRVSVHQTPKSQTLHLRLIQVN